MKKLLLKNFRLYRNAILGVLAVCILLGFACFTYYQKLQSTVRDEASGYMQEIAKQMGSNISKTISDNFAVLDTVASVLEDGNPSSNNEMNQIISEHKSRWNYQKIMLIDANGVAYDESGKMVSLQNDSYLQDVIVSKKPSLSPSQVIEGNEYIVFAIPIESMKVDGRDMVALAGSYGLSEFDKILSMSAFDGKGYAHIIRKDGTVVVRSSSPNAMQTGYNILHSLSTAVLADKQEMSGVYSSIENGDSGQIEFKLNSTHEYMTYTPLKSLEWSLLTFVPVSAVNHKSTMLLNFTMLMCALITLVFSLLLALLVATFFRNKRKLEKMAYVDTVTGGNTISRFNEVVEEKLSASHGKQYALIYSNIEKFKVLNEQFGRASCDEILRCIDLGVSSDLGEDECIGRLFADNFCLLVRYEDEKRLVERFGRWQNLCLEFMDKNGIAFMPPIVQFGVYVIGNSTLPLEHMIDRAKLSINESSNGELYGKVRYAIFDERIRNLLFREKHLEDMMESALKNEEFVVFLQPKYNTLTEQVGGAEALVRWKSQTEGMIYPDEFIPLFEKNGFVIQLDMFVFEEVCKTMRKWIDSGLEPVKVSVNCSRIHLKNPNFLERYSLISRKYNIPQKAIEIELTESTVFENVDTLTQTIRDIHMAGFGCSMDDFGSGYSSLNLIQDIPVDTLKLDKIFFRTASRDIQRTESVVGSIVAMSKALSMETVAEGVEEREQVDMLKRLGCDYIQGFYFAKPMPIEQFEKLAFGEEIGKGSGI